MSKITSVVTLSFVALAILAIGAEARGIGGGHGGGGVGHVGGGAARIGGGGGHISGARMAVGGGMRSAHAVGNFSRSGFGGRSARMVGSPANVRSFTGVRSASRPLSPSNFTRSAGLTQRSFRLASNSNRNLVTGSLPGAARASMLRNNAFASSHMLTRASFHGAFAGKTWQHGGWFWRHRQPFIVIGWFGGLFWPYAYWDFVDFTFWPYTYDVFWPFVYDDLYVGMFGPYAYEGPAYASQYSRHSRRARQRSATTAVVCNGQASALTNWPIQQITETVQPDQAQQSALNELKDATAKAVNALQSACPDDLPSTPTGRLAAMHKRIGTMLLALSIVQPPLQKFYDLLSDEQKARFNVIAPEAQAARRSREGNQPPDLLQTCGGEVVKPIKVPADRLAQALNPTEAQRVALDSLNNATTKAADFLRTNCPAGQTLTPPGRIAAMEKRLNALLEAIKMVEPELENFYGLLTDEQKARFNQLGSSQS
jgi:LTXXQ motif family protein